MQEIVDGCSYTYTKNGKEVEFRALHHDPIAGEYAILHEGKRKLLDIKALGARVQPVRPKRSRKTCTKDVYLYLVQLGHELYKLGCSADPERRAKQLKTGAGMAKLLAAVHIPRERGGQWRAIEKRVHDHLRGSRAPSGGREVFQLRARQISAVKERMRAAVRA